MKRQAVNYILRTAEQHNIPLPGRELTERDGYSIISQVYGTRQETHTPGEFVTANMGLAMAAKIAELEIIRRKYAEEVHFATMIDDEEMAGISGRLMQGCESNIQTIRDLAKVAGVRIAPMLNLSVAMETERKAGEFNWAFTGIERYRNEGE